MYLPARLKKIFHGEQVSQKTKTPNKPVGTEITPTSPPAQDAAFSIVGLGASAGGLKAFEQFFLNMPADSGMAFVLISHLDPDHASMLTEILQRTTNMPVIQVLHQMTVAPNCVYAITPNHNLTLSNGILYPGTPDAPRGHRMVIDTFMRSLAEEMAEQAIGIILSGNGSDGTLGLGAIQQAGGSTLVQEPDSAKYNGMPDSAIQAGYASYILPVDKMPAQLLSIGRKPDAQRKNSRPAPAGEKSMSRILMLLRSATGYDFTLYKQSTINRRVARRMSLHNCEDLEAYARYLKAHPAELQLLLKELLINVTSFFRDTAAFDELKQKILPQILASKTPDDVFCVWVAGCASGEEAYSIAMLLHELIDEADLALRIQIYSTDIDEDAIAIARAGIYPASIAQLVSPERLQQFFSKEEKGYRINKRIRESVVFAIQDVVKDPPFTRLDLLSCRNLMIYLKPELQDRLIPIFHYALKPGGVLLLSPSESIGKHSGLFTPLNRKWQLYRAANTLASIRTVLSFGSLSVADGNTKEADSMNEHIKQTDFAELTKRMLLKSFAPNSVLTDLKGNILYIYGDTGNYLRPAPGHPTLNIVEMARDGLQLELRAALNSAGKGTSTLNREVSIRSKGASLEVNFSLRPLHMQDGQAPLLLVSFQDVSRPARGKSVTPQHEMGRVEELERELLFTRENMQATNEELQSSNEELQSTNEEFQSTNEELQSTNEELETSKEELSSVNEELTSVNAELQSKIEQLSQTENDIKNLFDNTKVATIFINTSFTIKRFTREAEQIYRLVATDAGRPLSDIKSNIDHVDLLADARSVLDSLVPCEREVHSINGSSYLARIQPYRTLNNVIEGVVLTFTDISARVAAEAEEKAARKLAEAINNTIRQPLIVLDENMRVISASRSFFHDFQRTPGDTLGRQIYDLGNQEWDIPKLHELLENILPHNQGFEGFLVEGDFPEIGHCSMLLNASRIIGNSNESLMILLSIEMV
ncbi:MAG: SAM-dependent methyltransferase [Zetaproteobacteria bacterium CG17_big_fil_post_rev_8_21_14_2_50_50_13]|nr:MAG: SAM-dependent methyltransferase [Zetaproteobacteria bacterium CG17_big_fil_post_rev_8_21_14_2_50_50_13]PIY54970.1 MAG: SAM-dependent methyltransferase [Zetaproteobacteria bacterium CG_4_10_14_0_8_um_filter_49_80]